MKQRNKILSTVLMIIILINIVNPITNAANYNIGSDIRLKGYGSVESHVRNKENGDYAITTDLVGYYSGGIFFPAYCLNRGENGADNSFIHTVNISHILQNDETYNKIWRVVTAGYPYKSAEELGVDDWTYAYQATKTAIYDILGQTDVNNYYGIDETGERTVALMKKLVNIGENGISTYKTPIATIKKSGDMFLKEDEYIQNYVVTSNVEIETFNVSATGVPSKVTITNTAGEKTDSFKSGETFQIRIPRDIIETSNYWVRISTAVKTKSYPIFYGKTYDEKLQNYAITTETITLTNAMIEETYDVKTAGIKIRKIDKDTQQPLTGVMYEVRNMDTGDRPITKETDENGFVEFDKLVQGNYTIREITTNNNYVISQEIVDVETVYNKVIEITLENEHKKGNLQIQKVDKDNNNIAIGGIQFELYSKEFNQVVGTYTTDENGKINIENLRTGEYILREITTNQCYNSTEEIKINISWNETANIVIENELKKGKVKIVKVDKENPETKLQGVKFEVLDKNGNTLETIITNEEGEAYTKEYAIRDYQSIIIKEKETPVNYVLDNSEQEIELKENETVTITLANEKKYGKIKINKISGEYNRTLNLPANSPLENTKFLIIDEKGDVVCIYTTDKTGSVITEELPYGKYTIYEYETPAYFLKDAEPKTISITENNQIVEITFKNMPLDPELPKTGF